MTTSQPILLVLSLPIMIRPVMPGEGSVTRNAIEETFQQLQQWMPWAAKELEV